MEPSDPPPRRARWRQLAPGIAWRVFAVALAAAPALSMLQFVRMTGANVLSLDYVRYVGFVGEMADGNYAWSHYLRDTFVSSTHSMASVFAIRLGVVELTDWNHHAELVVGWVLAVARCLLLWIALGTGLRPALRWAALPLVAMLVFLPAEVSAFTWGDSTLGYGVVLLAISIAGLVLVRRAPGWGGAAVICVCVLMLATAGAHGPVTFPAVLAAMLLVRWPWRHMALVAGAMAAGLVPYLLYLDPGGNQGAASSFSLLRVRFMLGMLGMPFTEHFEPTVAIWSGATFLALALGVGAALYTMRKGVARAQLVTPLLLVGFGLGNAYATSVFRGGTDEHGAVTGLHGWYATYPVACWIALVGLALVAVELAWQAGGAQTRRRRMLLIALPALALLAPVALAAATNRSYEPKSVNLQAQTRVAASCVRWEATADRACELLPFTWGLGSKDQLRQLAGPLRAHGLSVYGRHQQWTLQGDWMLRNTRIEHAGSSVDRPGWVRHGTSDAEPPVFINTRLDSDPVPIASWYHLDLRTSRGDVVAWRVPTPRGARSQRLRLELVADRRTGYDVRVVGRSFHVAAGDSRELDLDIRRGASHGDARTIRFETIDGSGRLVDPRIDVDAGGDPHGAARSAEMQQLPGAADAPDRPQFVLYQGSFSLEGDDGSKLGGDGWRDIELPAGEMVRLTSSRFRKPPCSGSYVTLTMPVEAPEDVRHGLVVVRIDTSTRTGERETHSIPALLRHTDEEQVVDVELEATGMLPTERVRLISILLHDNVPAHGGNSQDEDGGDIDGGGADEPPETMRVGQVELHRRSEPAATCAAG